MLECLFKLYFFKRSSNSRKETQTYIYITCKGAIEGLILTCMNQRVWIQIFISYGSAWTAKIKYKIWKKKSEFLKSKRKGAIPWSTHIVTYIWNSYFYIGKSIWKNCLNLKVFLNKCINFLSFYSPVILDYDTDHVNL